MFTHDFATGGVRILNPFDDHDAYLMIKYRITPANITLLKLIWRNHIMFLRSETISQFGHGSILAGYIQMMLGVDSMTCYDVACAIDIVWPKDDNTVEATAAHAAGKMDFDDCNYWEKRKNYGTDLD